MDEGLTPSGDQARLISEANAPALSGEIPLQRTTARRASMDGGLLTTLLLILAQSFTIPVLAVGPSWAVWPTLADVAVVLLVIFGVLKISGSAPPDARGPALVSGLCALGALVSYALWVVLGVNNLPQQQSGIEVGGYQLARLAQALAVYWVVSRLRFDEKQRHILGNAVGITLGVVCAGVLLTGLGVVQRAVFAAHLPVSHQSGPWLEYILGQDSAGLGTIGYNHSYVAMQLLMLLALRLHLGSRHPFVDGGLAAIVWAATFLSGARNGLATATLFLALWLWKKPRQAAAAGVVAGTLILLASASALRSDANIEDLIERQGTIMHSTEARNLSGRDGIWRERLRFLNEEPIRWITGSGFGSAYQSGDNAHMLYLHLVVETGICGLSCFLVLFGVVLRALAKAERQAPKALWLCTVVLLVSGITQETLYPTPAFGGFLVLYSLSVALALQEHRAEQPRPASPARESGREMHPLLPGSGGV